MLCSHPVLLIYSFLQAWLYKALLSLVPEESQSLLQPSHLSDNITCCWPVPYSSLSSSRVILPSFLHLDFTKASNQHKTVNLAELISDHPAACELLPRITVLFPPPVTLSLTAHEACRLWGSDSAALQSPFQPVPEEMHLIYSLITTNTLTQPEAWAVFQKASQAFTSPSPRTLFLNQSSTSPYLHFLTLQSHPRCAGYPSTSFTSCLIKLLHFAS